MECSSRCGGHYTKAGRCNVCGEVFIPIKQPVKHLPDIGFKVIPHNEQRYETAGDYFEDADDWQFRVSALDNADYEFMVLIHELIEWHLTQRRGLSEPEIAAFDMAHPELDDPGADKRAPYHKEHMFSLKVEKMLCKFMGLDWSAYDDSFENLEYNP